MRNMIKVLLLTLVVGLLAHSAYAGTDKYNDGSWKITSGGDLIPITDSSSDIGSASYAVDNIYADSIWIGGSEYTSFAAGTDGNWTGNGLTTTLDAAPTKFIATHSSGDFAATGFTAGTGDITLENGQKIDGGTNNAVILTENSDSLSLTASGNDWVVDSTDGGVIFTLTDATDGTVDLMLNNDADDYIQFSTTTNQPLINFVGCNGKITAASGTIDFDNENLTTTGTLSSGATTVTSLIIGDETFSVPADDTVRIASNDAQTIFNVYTAATSNEDAVLLLSADASADNGDDWQIVSDGGTNSLFFQNDATGSQATYLTLSNVGAITTTGDVEIADDMDLVFGTNSDWLVQYDEGVDDQLLFITAGTAAAATTDPMVEFLVGGTPTADQQVFGVAKGTQASNTALFTVDEDGDVGITGTTTAAGAVSMGYEMVTTSAADPGVGVASVSKLFTAITSDATGDAADAVSLAAGMAGQMKIITLAVDAETTGTSITADFAGATAAALLEDAGDMLILCSDGTEWYIVYNNGATLS